MGLTIPVVGALLAVYIFWGGTYLAMKFAVETLPPFIMAGIRFITAGAIVYVWQIGRGVEKPKAIHWKNAAIVGGLLLFGGNGSIVWAEQMVSSGIAAIIVAVVPLWMTLLAWLWQGGERPKGMVFGGLVLGFIGIILLVKNSGGEINTSSQWLGYIAVVFASIFWATGSIYSRIAKLPPAPFMAIGMEMLTGGLLCLLFGLLTGEATRFDLAQVSIQSALSVGYLIIFGSIIGFSAYIWLLKVADPTVVSTYAYVNPVVAVILGWFFAGEQMTLQDGLGATIILLAVIIITKANSRKATVPAPTEACIVE